MDLADHTPRMRVWTEPSPNSSPVENAIVVASSDHQDGFDFETALLGQFERWDRGSTDGRCVYARPR